MKWFFAAMSACALIAATINTGYGGPPGWLRFIAAILSLCFAGAALTIWILERRQIT